MKTQMVGPTKCDLCARPIIDVFIDGKTSLGPWGYLCPICHAKAGCGLGTGKGQKYQRNSKGLFEKVEG